MSLVVRLTTTSSFDDRADRNAIARYCKVNGYEYRFSSKFDPIDMFVRTPEGVSVALELTCNACWTDQLTYPEDTIHIPRRKWKTFHEQTWNIPGKNFNRAEKAYLVVLNTAHTRAAFIPFSTILYDLALFTEHVRDIFDAPAIFVNIPTSYILKYEDLPPEQEGTAV